jgi:mRNA interferase MazF
VVTPDPRRGEIWWVDWSPGRGSEQTGRRPAVIVQTEPANLNPRYPNTIVAAVSTKGRGVRAHVRVDPTDENGLAAPSFVKCEQLMTLSKVRLERRLGQLNPTDLQRVAAALRIVLAL